MTWRPLLLLNIAESWTKCHWFAVNTYLYLSWNQGRIFLSGKQTPVKDPVFVVLRFDLCLCLCTNTHVRLRSAANVRSARVHGCVWNPVLFPLMGKKKFTWKRAHFSSCEVKWRPTNHRFSTTNNQFISLLVWLLVASLQEADNVLVFTVTQSFTNI